MSKASMKTALNAAYGGGEAKYDEYSGIMFTHADNSAGGTPGKASITILSTSNATSTRFNPFDDGAYPAFVENTDWKHNITISGWTFSSTTGLLTCTQAGDYRVSGLLLLEQSGSKAIVDAMDIELNGSPVWSAQPMLDSTYVPMLAVFEVILAVAATDTLGVEIDGAASKNLTVYPGSSINVSEIL